MNTAAKFVFGTDFREERRAGHHSDAELVAARAEAHAQGAAEGEARARACASARAATSSASE
jgi:hypothetical protein